MYNLLCAGIIESSNLYLCKNSQPVLPRIHWPYSLRLPIYRTRTNTSILTYMSPKQIVFWRCKAQARSASRCRCRCSLSWHRQRALLCNLPPNLFKVTHCLQGRINQKIKKDHVIIKSRTRFFG